MIMPFTAAQFLGVFPAYNAAIWPAQLFAYLLGIIAVAALWWPRSVASRVIPSILALLWAWNAIAYFYHFFSTINPAAVFLAGCFLAESALFAACTATTTGLTFRPARDLKTAAGLGAVGYALLVYPILGIWAGRGLMGGPMFGVAPCPTAIFTIGLLLLVSGPAIIWLSIIPVLWSFVGLAAVFQLGMPEDFGLPVASIVLAASIGVNWPGIRGTKLRQPPC